MLCRFLSASLLLGMVAFAQQKTVAPASLGLASKPAPPTAPKVEGGDYVAELMLVRYDMPRGLSNGFAPTRQVARRKQGPDAVDWPALTLNGKPIFRLSPLERVPVRLRRGADASSPFQQRGDEVLHPGNHWFRPIAWVANRKHIYTSDSTARCGATSVDPSGRYELWLFPLRIESEGGPQVKNVVLTHAGAVIFQKEGPWRSLTLLLPATEKGKAYELTVDGRGPLKCQVGLRPVKLGNPREVPLGFDARLPGNGAKIRVFTPVRAEEFPNQKEWAADAAAAPKFQSSKRPNDTTYGRRSRVSPLTIYAAALPHGMSGGFWKKGMEPDVYSAHIASLGFNAVFEPVSTLVHPADSESLETRAAALAKHGVRMGLQYDHSWARPNFQHPSLAFLAHTLPDWHQPLYRSLQLATQRFSHVRGFLGMMIGGDNAGYMALAPKIPPSPERPWGEAMIAFNGTTQPIIPRGPTLGPSEHPFEQPVRTQAEFMRHVSRYDYAFRQYGYFAEAVREADPAQIFTTASFGSSQGIGARGGWPWASLPGRMMFEGLRVQQAYDANTVHSSKPMHLVALIDRLRSYHPGTATWALVDNNKLFFGREAMQRAYVLALTRGLRGVGTNFIPDNASPGVLEAQSDLHAWMERYGAAYAATIPEASIGIYFGALEAVQRPVNTKENASPEELLRGSHEGKVTEALWLCHAAGWPARVVTYQELQRGPLPTSMKALLLVGLANEDGSWNWAKGLEPKLGEFVARGGRILLDHESHSPVPGTETGMRIASYVTQSELDATPKLLTRNIQNIEALRTALEGIAAPSASSDDPLCWAVPTRVKDTLYVTAVNWAFATGEESKEFARPADRRALKPEIWKTKANASLYVKPRIANLTWHTERPIYDVRLQRRLTPEEASRVDFTKEGFQWFGLPQAEIASASVAALDHGRIRPEVKSADGSILRGVPVEIAVYADDRLLTKISAVSDDTVAVPVRNANRVMIIELLSGIASDFTPVQAAKPRAPISPETALSKFAARKNVPLIVALTSAQEKDPAISSAARQIVDCFTKSGRKARLGRAGPDDVVVSLQPLRSPHRYPQWRTAPVDLVLIGTPQTNVLMMDQARGELFPPGAKGSVVIKSPFEAECNVLNILGDDAAGVRAWLAGWK